MASPRKFSEKIALHHQKQAEETAAFEQIMREVGSATREYVPMPSALLEHHLRINQSLAGSCRAGSLPNVNHLAVNASVDLQSALTSLEDMKQGRDGLVERGYRDSRPRHIGPHRRQFDKRVDCSPYSSPYLSPPPDTSWRRTNSDSALHHSAMNPADNYHGSTTPPANRRTHEDGLLMTDGNQMKGCWDPKKLLPPPHSRPKSCEVPGINSEGSLGITHIGRVPSVYPMEQDPNLMHLSIANNTGSLPDLTNLQFQSPLATPIDTEDQTGSPYSTSPQQQLSPSTLSPTSLNSVMTVSHVGGGAAAGSSNGRGVSPPTPHSPVGVGGGVGSSSNSSVGGSQQQQQQQHQAAAAAAQRRRNQHPMLTNLIIGGSSSIQHQGMATDTSRVSVDSYTQQQQHQQQQHHQQPSQYQLYQHQQHQNQQQQQQQQQQLGLNSTSDAATAHQATYRSNSPAETSYSAPPSPVSQTLSPVSSPGVGPPPKDPFASEQNLYYMQSNAQTNALQEHFQHFNMVDTPPASSVSNIFLSEVSNLQYSQGMVDGQDLLDGGNYYSSLEQYSHNGQSTDLSSPGGGQNHHTAPQTPQTPSGIPNIILTDFSSGAEDLMSRPDFAKELGSAMAGMTGPFDSDLFVTDELKAGLDPLDFDGLQMLTDPDMVADPATEDSFRLDRL